VTSPYEPPLNSDYLIVKLLVRKEEEEAFTCGMKDVELSVFRDKLCWTLLRAGKRIAPDDESADHFHYLHLWQTEHPINVWEGQFTVASDSPYAAMYHAIDRETQNILRVPAVYAPTKAFSAKPQRFFLLHELPLSKDWSQVLDWQWTLPVPVGNDDAAPALFSLSFAFQSVTGLLRTHLHVFESDALDTTPALTGQDAKQKLLEMVDLGQFTRPRNAAVDRAPPLREQNRLGISSDNAVKERTGIEIYERVTYQDTP
jgi:hypothetical protein